MDQLEPVDRIPEPSMEASSSRRPLPVLLSHFSKLALGALGGASSDALVAYLAVQEGRWGDRILVIGIMAFVGAVLASTLTNRVICYLMVVGSVCGAIAGQADLAPKRSYPLIALTKMTIGMAMGLLIGCWWTASHPVKGKEKN